jgi:hypothetical protein
MAELFSCGALQVFVPVDIIHDLAFWIRAILEDV